MLFLPSEGNQGQLQRRSASDGCVGNYTSRPPLGEGGNRNFKRERRKTNKQHQARSKMDEQGGGQGWRGSGAPFSVFSDTPWSAKPWCLAGASIAVSVICCKCRAPARPQGEHMLSISRILHVACFVRLHVLRICARFVGRKSPYLQNNVLLGIKSTMIPDFRVCFRSHAHLRSLCTPTPSLPS